VVVVVEVSVVVVVVLVVVVVGIKLTSQTPGHLYKYNSKNIPFSKSILSTIIFKVLPLSISL